jgi:hypothetical protein
MANIYLYQQFFLKHGLEGISSFELVGRESRATTQMKLKDSHMQWYLVGEQLFVGWNVEIFDGNNFLTYGPTSIIAHMPTNIMDQHPWTTSGEDNQFVVALAKHGLFN